MGFDPRLDHSHPSYHTRWYEQCRENSVMRKLGAYAAFLTVDQILEHGCRTALQVEHVATQEV